MIFMRGDQTQIKLVFRKHKNITYFLVFDEFFQYFWFAFDNILLFNHDVWITLLPIDATQHFTQKLYRPKTI